MRRCVFDIETSPLPETDIANLAPVFEAPGNYKDPVKIADNIEAQRVAWLQRAALSPLTGCVCAIGLRDPDGDETLRFGLGGEESEAQLLKNFWDDVRLWDAHDAVQFVGFNIFKFDLPFLIRRSWKLGVPIPIGVREGRYYGDNFIDLAQVWSVGNREEYISLDQLARFLGVGSKAGNGADFHLLPMEQKREYLSYDLKLTAAVAGKILV